MPKIRKTKRKDKKLDRVIDIKENKAVFQWDAPIVSATDATRCQHWRGCPQANKFEQVSGLDHHMSLPGAGGSVPVVRSNVSWVMITWSPPPDDRKTKRHTRLKMQFRCRMVINERQLGRVTRMLSPYDPDVLSLVTRMFSGPPSSEED